MVRRVRKEYLFSLGALVACRPHNDVRKKCSECDRLICKYCRILRQHKYKFICRQCTNKSIFLKYMDGNIDIDFTKQRL